MTLNRYTRLIGKYTEYSIYTDSRHQLLSISYIWMKYLLLFLHVKIVPVFVWIYVLYSTTGILDNSMYVNEWNYTMYMFLGDV